MIRVDSRHRSTTITEPTRQPGGWTGTRVTPASPTRLSGAGDLDVIIYSARKWARLALSGNPTVLLVLFVPDEEVVFRNAAGAELVSNAERFVSRLAAGRFLGYACPTCWLGSAIFA